VYERILLRMRELIRQGRYVLTVHAEEEMEADAMSVFDVEQCVLTGRIVERQRDRATGGWKYLIHGRTTTPQRAAVVARLGPIQTLIVLTVFAL